MTGALNYLKGTARVELVCRYSERAVNICARNHVDFWDLKRTGEGAAQMTVSIPGYRRLRQVAGETGAFTVRIVRRRGAPFFLWRIRKRYALTAGLAACLFLVGLSSLFVWQIDVTGNETVPTSQILAALRSEGVDIGTCVLDISNRRVSNDMLLLIPELSFITLNSSGSRIQVVVREKIPKPPLYDPDIPASVVAEKAGIITLMEVGEGWSVRAVGDTVDVGDELVSAFVPLGAGRVTHARARVWARTWHEMTLQMPLETARKEYTGEKKTRSAIILGGKRINFYFTGGNPYDECDKITVVKKLTLPGGAVLPVTLVRDTFDEYETYDAAMDEESAAKILSAQLLSRLEERIGQGYVVSTDFETRREEGLLTVTMRAECVEQIAGERQLTKEEIDSFRLPPAEE